MSKLQELLKLNHLKSAEKPKESTVEISRFEYNLLEMTYTDTTYIITEDDGTITTIKGEY